MVMIALFVAITNPTVGIITLVGGVVADSIPLLASRPRTSSWKRVTALHRQEFLEHLITESSGELQVRALEAYLREGRPEDEGESKQKTTPPPTPQA